MDLREVVENSNLRDALSDITSIGRHWFSQASPAASMLETLVKERGHDVLLLSLPPDWEYVLVLMDQSLDELSKIAEKRATQREQGAPAWNRIK